MGYTILEKYKDHLGKKLYAVGKYLFDKFDTAMASEVCQRHCITTATEDTFEQFARLLRAKGVIDQEEYQYIKRKFFSSYSDAMGKFTKERVKK